MNGSSDRLPVVGGNWKMNTTVEEAVDLAAKLVRTLGTIKDVEVILCPPFTNLQAVAGVLSGSPLRLGAQDVFWADRGAYTGEISPAMLSSVGATHVIVGHSERRHILGESDEVVARKLRAALGGGLQVILAVGETQAQREAEQTHQVLERQLRTAVGDLTPEDLRSIIIAYEPVWAIGTGLTASPGQAQDAHAFVRAWVREEFGLGIAEQLRIQYGGSVTSDNAPELLRQEDVDGALVGGASLRAEEFAAIIGAVHGPSPPD